ncbi:hypothetical protein [Paraburkholderia saeva]|uniref:hypothetical protein n=1 Tax=Paraburkholderia saeva TaxID=2777537 RepID=UPI001DD18C5B|nr:hypothetical protein [Paraburkholderia saeva]CAG4916157.1 hypothetical protein R70241_04420 [Paraburkholderia saeva]
MANAFDWHQPPDPEDDARARLHLRLVRESSGVRVYEREWPEEAIAKNPTKIPIRATPPEGEARIFASITAACRELGVADNRVCNIRGYVKRFGCVDVETDSGWYCFTRAEEG